MAISYDNVNRPNAALGGANPLALVIEEYGGIVEHTIERMSVLAPHVPKRSVRGTSTISNYAIGESTLAAVTPGVVPQATSQNKFNKASLTIDTLVYARQELPLLDTFQTQYDARSEIGIEHGRKIAKFSDQSFFIQAQKAALATDSKYGPGLPGHKGGTQVTMTGAGDLNDPAKMHAYLAQLFAAMALKDVNVQSDGVMLGVTPTMFYTMIQAEQIINTNYVTANGTALENVPIFRAFGVPVMMSNNTALGEVISGHLLSNAGNGNAYDGDFSKNAVVAFSPRALMAGETIPLESDVFYDKISKLWFVDSHLSYGVTTNRCEYAGIIRLP